MAPRPLAAGLALVGLLTAMTAVLVALIARRTGVDSHSYLYWNLFLAWIPLTLALALELRRRRRVRGPGTLALAVAWLLFLPNAPYLVTDFVHFGENPGLRPSADFAALALGAATGLLAGLLSVVLVQRAVRDVAGGFAGWLVAAASLVLASFGIYLGRILRLNSWDVVARPRLVLDVVGERLSDPLAYPRMVAGTAAVSIALLAAYLILYGLAEATERPGR